MEREDGTLLRAKAVPRGIVGHVTGHILLNTLSLIPSFLVILIPGAFLFDNMMQNGWQGWVTVAWVVLLGLLATLPIGMVIGSLVPGVQKVGTWGMLPILVLLGISGIFAPMQGLWGWVQTVSQVFPMYWVGLGMRSAFLPEAAAVLEIGESWRTLETVAVLGVWAVAGALVAPIVMRRMARRQSGSQVEAAKEQALQWVR
jgi:ABC-2 type transport system permease protein